MSVDYGHLKLKTEYWCCGDVTVSDKGGEVLGDCIWFGVLSSQPSIPRICFRVYDKDGKSEIKFKPISTIKLAENRNGKLVVELQKQGVSGKPGEESKITLSKNEKTGSFQRMTRMEKIAEAAGDLASQPKLFANFNTEKLPDDIQQSMQNPNLSPDKWNGGKPPPRLPTAQKGGYRADYKGNAKVGGTSRGAAMVNAAREEQTNRSRTNASKPYNRDDPALQAIRTASGRDPSSALTGLSAKHYNIPQGGTSCVQQSTITNHFGKQLARGFRNLGNSCYMAAIISVLVNLKPFAADLEMFATKLSTLRKLEPDSSVKSKMDFFCALLEVARNSASKNHGVMDLTQLKRAIGQRARQFSGREQQDAHEFYSGCIDAVSTDVGRAVKHLASSIESIENEAPASSKIGVEDVDASRGAQGGANSGNARKAAAMSSAVGDLRKSNVCNLNFNLEVEHTLLCENSGCNYSRGRRELFRDLSLSVPNDESQCVDMTHLLDAFFADNLLEYTCEKCGHKQSRASHKLYRLPRFLVIHCKRFKPNFEKGLYEKLTTKVNVARELNLGQHCSASTKAPPACAVADRIPMVMSPCTASPHTCAAADLTRSTIAKAAGAKAYTAPREDLDVLHGKQLLSDEVLPDAKEISRKLSFDGETKDIDGNSAGKALNRFLNGKSTPRERPSYGSGAAKRGFASKTTNAPSTKRARFDDTARVSSGGAHRSVKSQEDEDLKRALERSIAVTHRCNWMEGEEERETPEKNSARRRLQEGNKEESESSTAAGPVNIIDDDDDTPLLMDSKVDLVTTGTGKTGPNTPRKMQEALGGRTGEMEKGENKGFDTGEYSLGDEDEDLRRALELSTQDNSVMHVLEVPHEGQVEDGEVPTAAVEDAIEEEESYSDLSMSDQDERDDSQAAAAAAPPDARYTLQAVVSHLGKSAVCGHYVSDILAGGRWSRYDDAMVSSQGDGTDLQAKDWLRSGYLFVYAHSSCVIDKQ